jgi:undecaprenyl-diphosphatase
MKWELELMSWGNGWWSSSLLDQAIPWFTHLGSVVAVLLFIVSSSILAKSRKLFYRLMLLYGIQSAILYGLKYLVGRQRPVFFLEIPSRISAGPGEILDPSFPSGHTLYAFMMATLLAFWFPRYKIVFLIIAVMIGWTRIYLGLHYPTDVIAGGILGYAVTKLFLHWVDLKKPLNKGIGNSGILNP